MTRARALDLSSGPFWTNVYRHLNGHHSMGFMRQGREPCYVPEDCHPDLKPTLAYRYCIRKRK